MSQRRGYKRQYLWVDQEFYNWVMDSAKKHNIDGSAEVTHKLMKEIKLPEKVIFGKIIIRGKWKRK